VLDVHVQPGARRNGIVGVHGGRLKIKIASPPLDGEANRELVSYLSQLFAVPRSRVSVLRGASSRVKTIHVEGAVEIPPELLPG
jgi:uncharacterized protein